MNSNPLVSVIIPAYNHEKYVQNAIGSIIAQTYKNIELIVINDGSSDLTWQKIQEIKPESEERFVRVLFETKENEGSCKTLNKLISLIQGDFVYIIASDDIAKPHAIETEVKFLLENEDYGLVVGDNEIIDDNGKICYWDKKRNNVYDIKKARYKTFGEYLQKKWKFKFTSEKFGKYSTLYILNHVPNGYLIRKSIIDKINKFTTEAPLEDWYLMLQISKYTKMKYINEILYSYRWHSSNTIKKSEKMRDYAERTRIYEEKILENIDEKQVLPEVVDIKKNGLLSKKQGIPFVFEVLTLRKKAQKNKIIKFLNMKIFSFMK